MIVIKLLLLLNYVTYVISIQTYTKYISESINIRVGTNKFDTLLLTRINGEINYKNDWTATEYTVNDTRVTVFNKYNLSVEDSGIYKLSSKGYENTYASRYFKLIVNTVDVRLNPYNTTLIIAGSNVSIDCITGDNIRKSINWKYIPFPIRKNSQNNKRNKRNNHRETALSVTGDKISINGSLRLINVDYRDSGKYICKVRHGKMSYNDSIEFIVIGKKITSKYGESIDIRCDSGGNNGGNWIFQSFDGGDDYRCYTSKHDDGRFTISNFTADDEGIYNCNILDPTNSITSVVRSSKHIP